MNVKVDRNNNSSHKNSAVSNRGIVKIVVVSIVISVAVVFLTYEYFLKSEERAVYEDVLQPKPEKLVAIRKQEGRKLHSYAVIDSEKNIYRIPIEKAIDLIVSESKESKEQD